MDKHNDKANQTKINEYIKGRVSFAILFFKALLVVLLPGGIIFIIGKFTEGIILCSILAVELILFILFLKRVYKNPEKYKSFFSTPYTPRVSTSRLWADKRDKEDYKYDKEYGFVSSLFNRKISVSAINVSKEYVERCIDFFQTLNEKEIRALTEGAIQYCNEMRELYSFEEANVDIPESIAGKEILEYIYPHIMYIGREDKGEPEKVEFIIECECDWEEEHGLEIIVIDNKIVHVGSYEGDLERYR